MPFTEESNNAAGPVRSLPNDKAQGAHRGPSWRVLNTAAVALLVSPIIYCLLVLGLAWGWASWGWTTWPRLDVFFAVLIGGALVGPLVLAICGSLALGLFWWAFREPLRRWGYGG